MDETIGIKGGHQDTVRTMRIDREQKRKLEEYQEEQEIKQLEKEVKKKQRMVLIKVLPIAIAGGVIQTLYDTASGRKRIDKNDEYSKWRIKEYDADFTTRARGEKTKTKEKIVILPDGRKVTIVIPVEEEKIEENTSEDKKNVEEERNHPLNQPAFPKPIIVFPQLVIERVAEKKENEVVEPILPPKEEEKKSGLEEALSSQSKETIQKLKSRKIIDEYERQLKEIRFDLRNLIIDYNILVDESEKIHFSKEAEELLDRLSDVIRKIETLKEKIQIDHLEDFDDNYIYTLIEDYLSEFHEGKMVKEMKDSPLYVLISQKIDEITEKKEVFKGEVEHKKKEYEERESRFDELKDKYVKFDKFNQELADFQREQELLVKEVAEKVRKAVTIEEKVEVQVQALNRQSRRLLRLLSIGLLLPGNRAAKKMAASTAAYAYFFQNIINPPTTTKKYQVVTVSDYSRDIEHSIEAIDNANYLLQKTDKQIDQIIREIKNDFQEYLGVLPECDELLANLEKIKRDLHEKEYEMDKTKQQQERLLEMNNAKVLTRGEYPM